MASVPQPQHSRAPDWIGAFCLALRRTWASATDEWAPPLLSRGSLGGHHEW